MLKPLISPHIHQKSFDSASTPEKFAERFTELGTGYTVITDHGTLEGTRQVYDLTQKKFKNLKPILGVEGYFRSDSCPILTGAGIQKDENGTFKEHIKYSHITLHAQDEQAYSVLSRTLSNADLRAERHGSERKPLFDWSSLEELGSYNITGTSGCLIGMIGRHLMEHNDVSTAYKYYEKLRSVFKPGNFYVEIFPHKCDRNWESKVIVTDTQDKEHRFPDWKKVRTMSGAEGIKVQDLAREFNNDPVKALKKHSAIVEVMNNRKFEPLAEPIMLKGVVKYEGWLYNECRPWCPEGDVQLGVNRFLMGLAEKFGDTILISDDAHMAYPEEKIAQDIRLGQNGSWKFGNTHNLLSAEDSWGYFKDVMGIPQAKFESWLENGHKWASGFDNFKFSPRQTLPVSFYPKDTLAHAKSLIEKHGRMDWGNSEQVQRLEAEFDLLHRNGTIDLLPYFFVLEEVCREYAKAGMLCGPGRGSAAGLELAHLLGVPHVPPRKHKLSMDRFMTIDRVQGGKLPDIDQDLQSRDLLCGPDDASGWLHKRFGVDHVARISTDITLKLKSTIKDVFRAMEREQHGQWAKVPQDVEDFCKELPTPPQGVSDKEFVFGYEDVDGVWNQGLIETNSALQKFVAKYPKQWSTVQLLLGLTRQRGQHACAYLISETPIHNYIPLQTVKDHRVTSFTHQQVEAAGGLKMDFLVTHVLRDIQGAMKLIAINNPPKSPIKVDEDGVKYVTLNSLKVPVFRLVTRNGQDYDIYDLPEDRAVFESIGLGKVDTVFQLSGAAAKQGLKSFRPDKGVIPLDSIDDLSAFTALDRPGPLDAYVESPDGEKHNMLVEFANRAKNKPPIGALPILDELLPETMGVIVFQEQLEFIFQKIGGTTAIEAVDFRSRISKKKMVEVNKIDKPLFMKGAVPSLGKDEAEKVWGQVYTFGQYGFNKSHSVCYMYTAYACAWLKHHYPLEWWAAVLSNTENRDDINGKFWAHCSSMVDLPDIKFSKDNFDLQNGRIRAPLSLLKGIGEKAHSQIMSMGPFTSIEALLQRIDAWKVENSTIIINKETGAKSKRKGRSAINSTTLENLIISGAFDSMFPDITQETPFALETKLSVYAQAAAKVSKKKAVSNVASKYALKNPLVLYQLRKSIMPAYSEPLEPLVKQAVPDLFKGRSMVTKTGHGHYEKTIEWAIINGAQFENLKAQGALGVDLAVCTLAYVVSERPFSYEHKETKETRYAHELVLDMDGHRETVVKWGGEKGLPKVFNQPLAGSVISCMFLRRASNTDWYFANIEVLASALKTTKQEESSNESSAGEVEVDP